MMFSVMLPRNSSMVTRVVPSLIKVSKNRYNTQTGNGSKSKVLVYGLDLQLSSIVANENEHKRNIIARNMDLDVSKLVKEIASYIELHEQIEHAKFKLSENWAAIHQEKEKNEVSFNIDELRQESHTLKSKIKDLETLIRTSQERLFPDILKLPNGLHPKTSLDSDTIDTHGLVKPHSFRTQSHILLGYMNNCLEFSVVSPNAYYLKGPLAFLEVLLLRFTTEKLSQCGFSYTLCPDFCKSAVVKICEGYAHPKCMFEVDGGKDLILKGGASLESFVSYLTGTIVAKDTLPLRWYQTGRHYVDRTTMPTSPKLKGLFSVIQSTRIGWFAACLDSVQLDKELSIMLDCAILVYKELGLPFRTRYLSANSLMPTESLRIQFEIWSPAANEYVSCGYIACYGDMLSQRLSMLHGVGRTPRGFLHIVGGPVLSIPSVIACIMENLQTADGHFGIPDVLKTYSGGIEINKVGCNDVL